MMRLIFLTITHGPIILQNSQSYDNEILSYKSKFITLSLKSRLLTTNKAYRLKIQAYVAKDIVLLV